MRLVTVENDPDNPWSLTSTLRHAGYHCRGYHSVDALGESHWVHEADLAIIDGDGTKLDMRLIACLAREFWPDRPMLLIGNQNYPFERVARPDDSWLVKPVSARSLLAGVKSALGRMGDKYSNQDTVRFGQYLFESDGRSVVVGSARVALTQKEYLLALLLFRNLSRPVSRVYMARCVWRHDERINARTMTAHLSAIRSKLRLRAGADYTLSPIYNYGYRLDPVVRRRAATATDGYSQPPMPGEVYG